MKKLLAVFMCVTLLLVSMTSRSRSGGQINFADLAEKYSEYIGNNFVGKGKKAETKKALKGRRIRKPTALLISGIPYLCFEAANRYAEGSIPQVSYTGYYETADESLGDSGMFMNTEYDTLENLEKCFPGRAYECVSDRL